MRTSSTRAVRLSLCLLAASLSVLSAQSEQSKPLPVRYREPIQLYTVGLGKFSRPMSSKNAEAQAFFSQGFQMMYSFAKPEAVRSFRAAWKSDPDCAICYWGEAWAWGSYLNAPMSDDEAPFAYAAIQKAMALKDRATAVERAFIDAMAVRYVEHFDSKKRVEQDKAYAESTRGVSERYPQDLEAATLYGEALFLLEPRRGTRALDNPNVQRLHAVLERVLAVDDHHPGACHLYVHATESTVRPEKAEACAQFLGQSIPGASHMNHMPSHTWNRVGRWGDSVRANIEAWHSDLKAAVGEGFAIYPEHNLHMLLYAASYDGQGAIAMQAARDYAALTGDSFYVVLTLVRFGRFDEVAAVTKRPEKDVPAGLWDFGQGYARLQRGDAGAARTALAKVQKLADSSKASFRTHSARELLGTVGGILEGEIARAAGDLPAAISAFERAVKLEDAMEYDEPEPLPFAARHWLGAALVEAGRHADAERVYRAELEDHPHNGWSLTGLRLALKAQGRDTAEVDQDLAASLARSDTWIRASVARDLSRPAAAAPRGRVTATAIPDADRPFGTLRDQAAMQQMWLKKRLDTFLPALMRTHGIDLWVVPMREYNEDPVFSSIVAPETFAARRRTIYVFFDKCASAGTPVTASCVERIALGGTSQGGVFDARSSTKPVVAAVGGRQAELWGDEQWQALKSVIEERKPKVIGIDRSKTFAFTDGLSSGELQGMSEALGSRWTSKFREAEALPLGLIASRLPEEDAFFEKMTALVWQMTQTMFSDAVIVKGETRTSDLVWWWRQRVNDQGLGTWFQPSVDVQRQGSAPLGDDPVIQPGDVLHCDVGITVARLNTDTQHEAYVLKPGETDAPAGLKKALANANAMQDIAMEEIRPGRTGNEILASVLARMTAKGINGTMYSHPIGVNGHGAGPLIGLWDYQAGVPGRGDAKVIPSMWFSVELQATTPVPEWGGQPVRMAQEEDMIVGADGKARWALKRQDALFVVK